MWRGYHHSYVLQMSHNLRNRITSRNCIFIITILAWVLGWTVNAIKLSYRNKLQTLYNTYAVPAHNLHYFGKLLALYVDDSNIQTTYKLDGHENDIYCN